MAAGYFEEALHHFIKDFNYGGAIDHLTEKGYSLRQIRDRIGGHLSDSFLREQMMQSYLKHDRLLLEEPGSRKREKLSMVRETGPYGRVSFRQVREVIEESTLPLALRSYHPQKDGRLAHFLLRKTEENNSAQILSPSEQRKLSGGSYLSLQISSRRLEDWSDCLDRNQLDYLEGFRELSGSCYLRIDSRVAEIAEGLYEAEAYQGHAYFLDLGQKWEIS